MYTYMKYKGLFSWTTRHTVQQPLFLMFDLFSFIRKVWEGSMLLKNVKEKYEIT